MLALQPSIKSQRCIEDHENTLQNGHSYTEQSKECLNIKTNSPMLTKFIYMMILPAFLPVSNFKQIFQRQI